VVILRRRALAVTAAAVNQITAITRAKLPLGPALLAASLGERGRLRNVLAALADNVNQGTKLFVAMRESIPRCPALVESVVRAGENAGQLPRALAILEVMLADRLRCGRRITQGYWVYPVVLLLGMWVIVSGVMISVIPKFLDIFLDFGTPLPASTRALIRVSDLFLQNSIFPCMAFFGVVAAVITLVIRWVRPRQAGGVPAASWLLDTIRWCIPIVRDIEQAWATAASVEVLGMGCAAGLPLDRAAEAASQIDVNVHVRGRFREFATMLAQGEPPENAARRARLGSVAAGAIGNVVRGCAPDVALGHAARYYRATARRWWHVLGQFVWPAITVTSGLMVGFIALALFEPLVALINSVMSF
jgi:type II secretory pathway component PulF